MPLACASLLRSKLVRCFACLPWVGVLGFGMAPIRAAPSVASINLCADQLVLSLADSEQILSVSWLSADPEESMLANIARNHRLNYGSAEEILQLDPDVILGGAYTGAFTRRLLSNLGYEVVAVTPAQTLADIERNVLQVADAVGQPARGQAFVARFRERVEHLRNARIESPISAVVVRPGGFTVGRDMLADRFMTLAGLRNIAAENGLDRWGSLSMETLLLSEPELLIVSRYRRGQPSLANAALDHPALTALGRKLPTLSIPAGEWSCGLPQSLDSVARIQRTVHELAENPVSLR